MLTAVNTTATPPPIGQTIAQPSNANDRASAPLSDTVSKKVDRFKALATATLDTQAPLKDRIKAMAEFYTFSRNNTITVEDVNSDQALIKELNDLGSSVRGSDLSRRGEALLSEQNVFALRAVVDGKPMATGMIQHFDGLSAEDKQILFISQIDVTYGDGTRPYSSPEQYRASLVRTNDEQSKLMAGSTVGGAARAEKQDMLAIAQGRAAPDLAYLQKIRGSSNVDIIQLSPAAAKAAAQTLSQPAADGANDDALKALETLKQVSAQQREWLKSIQEGDKDKADETGKSGVKDLSANASAISAKAINGEGTETKTPGTLVSVEA
jgi:hypothetical protein